MNKKFGSGSSSEHFNHIFFFFGLFFFFQKNPIKAYIIKMAGTLKQTYQQVCGCGSGFGIRIPDQGARKWPKNYYLVHFFQFQNKKDLLWYPDPH
jgi:hypothetical protein